MPDHPLAQAWAVLSGIASPERADMAVAAVEERLVDKQAGLLRLLTPPFDKTPHDPGYIKGYVRQAFGRQKRRSHAAVWSVMAFAGLGQGDKAARLFSLINPINSAAGTGRVCSATRWNPT